MKPLEIKTVSTMDEMKALKKPWNDLLLSSISPTVFDSWEWQYNAARYISDRKPQVLTAYSANELVAILPLRPGRIKVGGLWSANVWRCLGGGITDYNAFLVKDEVSTEALQVFGKYLRERGHLIELENVLPGSALDMLGRHLASNGFGHVVYESKYALTSELSGDYESFMKTRKKKFRKTIRNNRNYMDRDGGYSYHTEDASPELLEILFRLHTSRWEDKGESGALAQQKIKNFHRALLEMDDKPFDIRYYTIRHNGDIIAILYGFSLDDRFYAYLSGFDSAHNRISPGNMIINHCISSLYDAGAGVFDMLRGDMKYKQTWATTSNDMQDAIYFPPGLGGRMPYMVMKMVRTLKNMIPGSVKKRIRSTAGREA